MNSNRIPQVKLDEAVSGPGFILKQKNSECCRCCCCQPPMHWTTHDYAEELDPNYEAPTKLTIIETSSWIGRTCSFCMPGHRQIRYNVYQGVVDPDQVNQESVMTIEKNCTCGSNIFLFATDGGQVRLPCCFNLPYFTTKDQSGKVLGTTRYLCNPCIFVPKFSLSGSDNKVRYLMSPDTCCLGCCVRCRCGQKGAKCCSIPFLIRDVTTREKVDDAKIVDLWAGFKKECCTRQQMYQTKYPLNADTDLKATMLGSALLLDLVVFEQEQS